MTLLHVRNAISLLSLAVLAVSCGSSRDLNTFPGLGERVRQYYELEKKGDWAAAYEFRTSEFKKSVPKDRYVTLMQRDSSGWQLVDYRIKSVKEADGKVKLEVVFKEIPPKDFLPAPQLKGKELGPMEFEDESVWVLEGGNWYSHAPGKRAHLSLNSALAGS
jgi:hypothetical protein